MMILPQKNGVLKTPRTAWRPGLNQGTGM